MAVSIHPVSNKEKGGVLLYINRVKESPSGKEKSINGEPVPVTENGSLALKIEVSDKKTDALTLESLRKAGAKSLNFLRLFQAEKVVLEGNAPSSWKLAVAEGLTLGNYRFSKYLKNEPDDQAPLKKISIAGISAKEAEELNVLLEAVQISRDMVNEPPAGMTATIMAKTFVKLGKAAGFKTEVLEKRQIEALKMGGLLAVNKGSHEPPTFTVMEYKPAKAVNKKPYVLVGKGVSFDSGGLNIKTSMMEVMKSDMAGAAAVAGTLYAVAKAGLPVHIVGIVPATDNRPGPDALAPGDIIKICDGTSVEILNTDAEGRLILADGLSYAHKYKPEAIIDLATLTGAAMRAIGTAGIVGMGTLPEPLLNKLKEAGNETHERIAEFPLWDEYGEQIKSNVADIANLGGPLGGAITAGKFLEHFTGNYPWMHLDIAGPSFMEGNDSYRIKGGTGVGVRLLFTFFKKLGGNGKRTS